MLILAAENLEALIHEAAQNKDWLTLAIAAVLLIVPVVMKALGKKVPLLDSGLDLVAKILPALKKKPVEPPPAEGEKQGLAAVVPIEDAKKDK